MDGRTGTQRGERAHDEGTLHSNQVPSIDVDRPFPTGEMTPEEKESIRLTLEREEMVKIGVHRYFKPAEFECDIGEEVCFGMGRERCPVMEINIGVRRWVELGMNTNENHLREFLSKLGVFP